MGGTGSAVQGQRISWQRESLRAGLGGGAQGPDTCGLRPGFVRTAPAASSPRAKRGSVGAPPACPLAAGPRATWSDTAGMED